MDKLSKDLELAQQCNETLQHEIEQLKNELQQSTAASSKPRPELRYSWLVTDLDAAIAAHSKPKDGEVKEERKVRERVCRVCVCVCVCVCV